ncbi:DUF732 domain-containing protein [Mycobacterium montefiorense]|nr:DUF732 domain-containing protein [Mycobacterium montefiorense]
MKLFLALLGVSLGIVVAPPAYPIHGEGEAATDESNEVFIDDLTKAGIGFQDPGQAIEAGKSVCGLISRGVSGLQLLNDLRDNNPGLTTNGAAQFATISAKSYCPRQLEASAGPKKPRRLSSQILRTSVFAGRTGALDAASPPESLSALHLAATR